MTVDCAKYIRSKNKDIKLLIGGTHVTATGIASLVFDSVFIGEGEYIIQQALSDIKRGKLYPTYKSNYPVNVDALPIPDRSLIPGSHGGEIFSSGGEGRNENLITSRGCAFNCAFCASRSMWGRNVRHRELSSIQKELSIIAKANEKVPLRICDDNMTVNEKRLKAICTMISLYGFKWRCSARAEDLTPETCKTLYGGGCREVSVGIESGDQNVLDFLNKKTTVQKMLAGCRNARTAGVKVRALFMIGTPGEKADTPEKNRDMLINMNADMITLSTFIPLPGTDIYNSPEKFNCEILSHDFARYNKDYFIRKNGNSYAREYTPLIHNKFLTIEQMKGNVKRMEAYAKEFEVNKG